MNNRTDAELLRDYAASRSEAAFCEIVRRYADFVYSAALRQVGDPEQARDVAQVVFTDLTRKAGSLGGNTLLIGWLCHAARLSALEQLRTDRRRLQRERQAMELLDPPSERPDDWNAIRPMLDEAIASLGHEDRNALLLRFFKNESLASVGTTLGVSEDAAQKRVSRALDKLRDFLQQRGITTTAAALSVALTANAVQAAPAGVALSLVTGALANAGAAGSSTAPLLKLFTLSNMKTGILIFTLAGGLVAVASLQMKSQRQLRDAHALLEQRAEELATLRAASEQAAGQSDELNRLRAEAAEVVRLRGETARLRRELSVARTAVPQAMTNAELATTREPAPQQVHITAMFVSVPAASVPAQTTPLVLGDAQARKMMADLNGREGVEVLSRPQMVTLCGREAHFQISDPGLSSVFALDVLSDCSTNSSDLNLELVAALTDPGDPASRADSLPLPLVRTPLKPAEPNGESLAQRPADYHGPLVTVMLTNSISLRDGQTVVLHSELPAEAAQRNSERPKRNILIFVTPTLIDAVGNRVNADDDLPPDQSAGRPASNP